MSCPDCNRIAAKSAAAQIRHAEHIADIADRIIEAIESPDIRTDLADIASQLKNNAGRP